MSECPNCGSRPGDHQHLKMKIGDRMCMKCDEVFWSDTGGNSGDS